jgi:hypothetical protein
MRKAVTLAELMIAVLYLSIVFGAILLLFTRCMILNESNRNLTTAASHANYVMEDIRSRDNLVTMMADIDNGVWSWNQDLDFTNQALERLPQETISVCYCADTCGACVGCADAPGDPLRVFVNVTWDDRFGRNRDYEIETLFTNY